MLLAPNLEGHAHYWFFIMGYLDATQCAKWL
ncbi:biosynthetic protein [Pseudoalteromonas luteoviolacea DSM 6061]|nr:biosynthetic protein [Pseudoalteromonas luteoviolacea DSM 6061]